MKLTEPVQAELNDPLILRAVWDQSADAMSLSDENGTVLAVNPAYCRLYGFTAAELVGQSFARIFPEEARAQAEAHYREVYRSGEESSHESHVRSAEQVELVVHARASFIERDGRRVGMLSTIRDITAQRRVEAERDAFVALASHDLRQPLALIKGRCELLLRCFIDDLTVDQLRRNLQAISSSVEDLSGQLQSLVDAVRVGVQVPRQLRLEQIEITSWLTDLVDTYQRLTDEHAFRLEVPAAPVVVEMDGPQMRRAINNVLSNAQKYSPTGSEVLVRASCKRATPSSMQLVIEIADRGMGIPEAELQRIFEPNYRASNVVDAVSGSGLGLSGVLDILRQHGGSVAVESNEGQGTQLRLYLPLDPRRYDSNVQEHEQPT